MKPILALIALLLSLFVTPAMAEKLTISTFDGHPYISMGIERVMKEAYQRIGLEFELVKLPNSRALEWANSGKYDAELFRKKNGIEENYTNLIQVPVSVYSEELFAFTKKKNISISGWESLQPYTVGYARGFRAVEVNLPSGTRGEAVTSMEQAFKKLDSGRNDLVVDFRSSGLRIVKNSGFKDIRMLEVPLFKVESFHYLHVKNKHLMGSLTEALQQMEREGLIEEIHKQVGLEIN